MSRKSQTAVIIGRFQPFHLGHLELVKQTSSECGELFLLIGSSQENYTIYNPFTTGERIKMIRDSLINAKFDLNKILITHIPDEPNNARWFSNIRSYLPPFDVFYTGNAFMSILLEREEIEIRQPNFRIKDTYNGSKIRKMMVENESRWEQLVPLAVKNLIFEIKGVDRMQKLNNSWADSPNSRT